MLTNDNKQYKQCRINSAPDEVGVADLRSRKKAVLESTQPMIQVLGVRDASDLLWLTRERRVAHHIYVETIAGATMKGKEEATAEKWTRGLANPDIVRRGTGVYFFNERHALTLFGCVVPGTLSNASLYKQTP